MNKDMNGTTLTVDDLVEYTNYYDQLNESAFGQIRTLYEDDCTVELFPDRCNSKPHLYGASAHNLIKITKEQFVLRQLES
jgi:hypothetical protein